MQPLQRLLTIGLLLLASNAAYAQFFSKRLERSFFRDVLGNESVHISMQQATWRQDELRPFYGKREPDPDFPPTRSDTLMDAFHRKRFQRLIAIRRPHHWKSGWPTLKTELVKEPGFTNRMKLLTGIKKCRSFEPEWSALSRPIFWNGGHSALLKADHTGRRLRHQDCNICFFLFELRENKWDLVSPMGGCNCLTD